MKTLWNKKQEEDFFIKALKFAAPEQLFYPTPDGKLYAYWPKGYKGAKTTLQSRNSFIGAYTERWTTDLFKEIAKKLDGYVIQGAICEEIALTKQSPADVAICKANKIIQKPQDILMLIEVKMSIVWNWELIRTAEGFKLVCIGDYKSHQGNPGLLRSDSMLKAIGKSINIRVSSYAASRIPILILGNTPIRRSYYKKVDLLRKNGIIQGFWSVNSCPLTSDEENIKKTEQRGFYRFDNYWELERFSLDILLNQAEFFSSMQTKRHLGEIIEIANKEQNYEDKAQRFLELLRQT
ncbi:MAG: hypothetical protein D6780_01880 [Candidatus Dadabacteria bacterium]|nr:MAG: hypothetical protein D6780_01880 [Candidatus Dadabacteria bacterium]